MRTGDGAGLNSLRRMPGVFENILGIPSERVERNEQYAAADDPNNHQFVAVTADEAGGELIIGTAGLSVYSQARMRHCGGIGIMIHRDYQGMGVGSALMEALLDMADNWLMLVRVELSVFCSNERAVRLYEKYGFVIEGHRRAAAIRFGKYEDEYSMARIRNLPPEYTAHDK